MNWINLIITRVQTYFIVRKLIRDKKIYKDKEGRLWPVE